MGFPTPPNHPNHQLRGQAAKVFNPRTVANDGAWSLHDPLKPRPMTPVLGNDQPFFANKGIYFIFVCPLCW